MTDPVITRFNEGVDRRDREDWRNAAACREIDPEMWHPEKGHSLASRAAVKICRTQCEVRRECLIWALKVGEHGGIVGGITDHHRRPFHVMVRKGAKPEDVATVAIHGEEVLRWSA